MISRNKKIIMILSTVFTIVLALSLTYAFFYYDKIGSTISIESGSISINFTEEVNYFTIHNGYPKSDVAGMIDVNYYDFTVSGSKGEYDDILYEIQIEQLEGNTLTENDIKVYLTNQNDDKLMNPILLSDAKVSKYNGNRVVYTDYIYKINQVEDYRLRLWVDESYTENVENSFSFKVVLHAVNGQKPPTVAEEIINTVVVYSVSEPTTFTGGLVGVNTDGLLYNEADENQQVREYRYSGRNVNNYVYFNCTDTVDGKNYGDEDYPYNETNCELWRIVGIFKNSDNEWNLKLMRNTVLQAEELVPTYTYKGTTYNIQYSTGNTVYWTDKINVTDNNDWTTAGLQYFLNTNKDSNDTAGYYSTIKDTSKALIDENYTYYLGNVIFGSSGDNTQTAYINERDANNKHSGNQSSWPGAIALLYPSDYGYSAHSSYWNSVKLYDYQGTPRYTSWMMNGANHSDDEWLLSPSSTRSDSAISWRLSGYLHSNFVSITDYGARPVLNLKSETNRLKGDGTSGTPYVIIGE